MLRVLVVLVSCVVLGSAQWDNAYDGPLREECVPGELIFEIIVSKQTKIQAKF